MMDKEKHQTNKDCKHIWNYEIINMGNSNYFIEKCEKCLMTIKTLELFKKEN